MRTSVRILLAAVVAFGSHLAVAADCAVEGTRCDGCGCRAACVDKCCQVVCEMKKETKTCWCVECEEICPLMPGCHDGCCDCPPPRCGHPKCVKKLVKKEYQVEKPVYKCVVRHLCASCCSGGSADAPSAAPNPAATPTAAPIPPAPAVPVPAPNAK